MQLGVREVEHPAEHVAELVVQRAAGREGLAREPRAGECGGARTGIAGLAQRTAHALGEQAQALAGGDVGQRRGSRGPQRLDAVRDGVHAARRGDVRGQVVGQLGVVDDEARRHARLLARRLAPLLRDAPDGGQLGAGIGRRHRRDREAGGERDGLRQPDRRSPAERDEAVGRQLGGRGPRGLGVRRGDVHAHADDAAAGAHLREQALAGGGLRAARDHERAPQPEARELRGQIADRARAEDDAAQRRLVNDAHAARPGSLGSPCTTLTCVQPTGRVR